MSVSDLTWHRLFSRSCSKDWKLPLGEMTFFKDFVNDTRGDLYPVICKSDDCREAVYGNAYRVSTGSVQRLLGQYFPYAGYEVSCRIQNGECGFSFRIPNGTVQITVSAHTLFFREGGNEEAVVLPHSCEERTLLVSCRKDYFDVYFRQDGQAVFLHTFQAKCFENCIEQSVFQRGCVALYVQGSVTVNAASFYIDGGVAQADLRPVHWENGDVLYENGKVYLTFSVRMQENAFQGILSWVPGTSQIEFTGALFFDCGDGKWRNYLASSLLYNRKDGKWYIWLSAFENQVRLAYGKFEGDPRYGVNVVDVTVMPAATETNTYQDFVGFHADEDPDFYYNEEEGMWYLAICRVDQSIRAYRYAFFTSDDPFTGYRYIGCGKDGAETGGSFVTVDGQRLFVCGNDFKKRANYRIYSETGMEDAKFDFDDGGFRGWGSIIPVKLGSRTRYFWITFDRHRGSSYNWSYGNLYCFEGIR